MAEAGKVVGPAIAAKVAVQASNLCMASHPTQGLALLRTAAQLFCAAGLPSQARKTIERIRAAREAGPRHRPGLGGPASATPAPTSSTYPRAARGADGEVIFFRFKRWTCWVDFAGHYHPEAGLQTGWVLRLRMKDPPVDDSDLVAVATVNVDLGDDFETGKLIATGKYILVKDWSENEGMLAALIAAKVVEDTGDRITTGFCEAALCHLLIAIPVDAPAAPEVA